MSSPEPQLSATVILVGPDPAGQEPFAVFLLRRSGKSSFMPGRYVFPGGGWEPGDGPPGQGGLRACALRELWEEAGVILASDPEAAGRVDEARRQSAREEVTAGKVSLPDALAGLGLAPGPERLTPLARWITPLARPRRFDTVFYLAPLPPGQTPSPDQTEVSSGEWLGPARALAANAAGRAPLAPPQVKLMGMLAEAGSAEDLWSRAAGASLAPVLPVLHLDDQGGRTILLPSDPDYAAGRPQAQARPCPAGQSSRLVHVSGVWLPFIA